MSDLLTRWLENNARRGATAEQQPDATGTELRQTNTGRNNNQSNNNVVAADNHAGSGDATHHGAASEVNSLEIGDPANRVENIAEPVSDENSKKDRSEGAISLPKSTSISAIIKGVGL